MANKSVLELAVGTGQWDAGLKKAKDALNNFTQAQGGLQSALAADSDKMQQFVKMMGQMDSQAKTAKGQLNDYKGTIEQLTMQYNRMTDAQKKTIGQDYLQAIDHLKQKYQSVNKEIEEMNRQLKATPEITPSVSGGGGLFGGGKFDGMLQVFGGNMMTKAAGMAASFAAEIGDCVKQGIELAKQGEGIRIAFERLGRGDILDGLREATHGTVTDLELMKAAVKFNDFKLNLDEMGTLLAFAQQKAKDTGQSVDYMVDSIVTGLGRKSLMILDNLGLSATEVKDRMKETGDMTKAVGAIIREQMAKAGDYVETAADRAAKANVSLQNKMEELGRKFAPLQEASNNFWTSMKIGIMDVVGGPLTDLLNKLTEAGRLMNAYGKIGGNAKVGRMTSNLANASEGNRQSIYQQQQEQFWRYINPREQQIQDIQRWQRGERGEALQSRISAITEKYGSLDATKIRAEVDAAKKMLADYQQAAKTILNPAPTSPSSIISTTIKNTTGGRNISATDPSETIKSQFEQMMLRAIADANSMNVPVESGPSSIWTALTKETEKSTSSIEELTKAFEELNKKEGVLKDGKGGKTVAGKDGDADKFASDFSKITGSVSSIASGLQALGVEIPEGLSKTIAVVQTISGILTAILAITTAIQATSSVNATASVIDAVVPFARGGIVPHAASGYYVPGTRFSGDTTPILANAGELVLNKSSQSNLAAMIRNAESLVGMIDRYQNSFLSRTQYGNEAANFSGGAMQNLRLSASISGEQIRLVLNNNGRRTGRGEYVTSNFTRG